MPPDTTTPASDTPEAAAKRLADWHDNLREQMRVEAMKVDHESTDEETRLGTMIYHAYMRMFELESQLTASNTALAEAQADLIACRRLLHDERAEHAQELRHAMQSAVEHEREVRDQEGY